MTHSPPTDPELRDAAQCFVERHGYKVTRVSPALWTLEKQEGAVLRRWRTGVRAVVDQPTVEASKSNFYIAPFKPKKDGASKPSVADQLWIVAWYRIDATTNKPEIQVTLGERGRLDDSAKYKVKVDGRPIATMQSVDYMVRESLPL
jgi:hypothetical protein